MQIDAFMAEYGTSARRLALIHLLRSEIAAIEANGWTWRAWVFGSLVNKPQKAEPGDIDVLLSISAPFATERWRKSGGEDIHIKHNFITGNMGSSELRPCNSLADMIRLFNQACEETGEDVRITPDDPQPVEVTL